MTINEVKNVVLEAKRTTGKIRVKGYRNSSGEVADLEVRLLGPDGYRGLIGASLEMMEKEGFKKPEDESIDAQTWGTALMQQEESWRKTMANQQPERKMGDAYKTDANGFVEKVDDPDYLLLSHMEKLSRDVTEEVKSATKSRPLTLAKKAIVAQAPIGNYIGRLSFEPGKFESVEIIK